MLALLSAGNELWPTGCYRRIAALALIAGVAYTTFGEWPNVVVRASWAYSEWPPIVSAFGLRIGISPLLQDYGALSRLCSNECCNSQVQQRRTVAPLLILISRSVRTQRPLDARVQRVRSYLIIPSLAPSALTTPSLGFGICRSHKAYFTAILIP